MNIIVCIKQVPDISKSAEIKINPETNTLIREGIDSIVNPFDLYAVEEGLRIKEKFGGKVTVISMGPPQAKQAIKEAILMGADEGILISDSHFAGADTLATSYTLAQAIKKIGSFDLILCGKQAIDGDTAQVGPGIAEFLDIPVVAFVRKIDELKEKPDCRQASYAKQARLIVERMSETGVEIVETELPALFTVVKEINQPRLPSLKRVLMAKNIEIPVWGMADISAEEDKVGLKGSPTQVIQIFTPEHHRKGKVLDASNDNVIIEFVGFINKIK